MSDKIVSNQIRCKNCGDKPFSAHAHDFKMCRCGSVGSDGGPCYLRRIGDKRNWEELSIVIPEEKCEKLVDMVQSMIDTGRNSRGILYGVLREMRDMGIDVNRIFEDEQED